MPQISLYIDESTLKKVESAALREHVSISRWVAEQIRAKVDLVYPKDFEALFGSVRDSSFERPSQGSNSEDATRVEF